MRRWWASLTFRLIVASLAWTLGLVYIAHLVSVFMLFGPGTTLTRFGRHLVPSTLAALAIMFCGALIVRRVLSTFRRLRQGLIDVHHGREQTVRGEYMREVQPVVTALNQLLEHQDRRVRDALAKAGDLAHGLKTPLAVLTHEADRASAAGHRELAATLTQQIVRMQRYIDYHLAHARAAASGPTPGAHCRVVESVEGIVRTLHRLHAQRGIRIDVDVPPLLAVRVQREDLDEMLGNLLDNACKWAHTRIVVDATEAPGFVVITVEDDGEGIPVQMRDAVLQRGVRADEAAPGSGFGLAIVGDLAELYRGEIVLEDATIGGLRARLRLPQASPDHPDHSGTVQVGSAKLSR
jgi:signal transduction histidine kinase